MGVYVGSEVKDVSVKRLVVSRSLVKKIQEKQGLDKKYVELALRYNIISVKAFANLIGSYPQAVTNRLRGYPTKDGMSYGLNYCVPFADGQMYVYRNAKAEMLIFTSNDYDPLSQDEQEPAG